MRVLIVGNGRMGTFHARTLINAGDHVETLDPHKPADHQTWRTVPKTIDAAIIASPIPTLHEQALEAIDRGLPTLIEKPAGATNVQTGDLWAASPELAVGYLERGNPAVTAFLDHVTPGCHLTYTRLGPRTTTSIALDVASHDLDLHLLHTQQPQQPQQATLKHIKRGITLETETATIHAGRSTWPIRTIEGAGYKVDLITRTLHHPSGEIERLPFTDLLERQWDEFKNGTPLATINDALHVMDTLHDCGALDMPLQAAA